MSHLDIVLDVDGVIADFAHGIIAYAKSKGRTDFPESADEVQTWGMCGDFRRVFNEVSMSEDFWLGLDVLQKASTLNFHPMAYLTARPIRSEVTAEWLNNNGFGKAPVITVGRPQEKIKILRQINADVLVDDYYVTVSQMNNAKVGCKALLYEAPYQVGHKEELEEMVVPLISDLRYETIKETLTREFYGS